MNGAPVPFPVHYRKPNPYENLRALIAPGQDAFPVEAEAAAITARWNHLFAAGSVPLADGFRGSAPLPTRYKEIDAGIFAAEFDSTGGDFQIGLKEWIAKLGAIRSARFFVLPGDRLRFEIASTAAGVLNHRVGLWKQRWRAVC